LFGVTEVDLFIQYSNLKIIMLGLVPQIVDGDKRVTLGNMQNEPTHGRRAWRAH